MRWFVALVALAGCDKTDDNCDEWTVVADECREAAGMDPVFVERIDCAVDGDADFHACMVIAWNTADCTSEASVDAVMEGPALECTQ